MCESRAVGEREAKSRNQQEGHQGKEIGKGQKSPRVNDAPEYLNNWITEMRELVLVFAEISYDES